MFEVIYHNDAEAELKSLPIPVRIKMDKLIERLENNPRLLREPHTKFFGQWAL